MNELRLSRDIERALVAGNIRHMQAARAALQPGYVLRGAAHLRDITGTVLIATGFPVAGTFETDGPVGAMALYLALETLGARPIIACGALLSAALGSDYAVLELNATDTETAHRDATVHLQDLQPRAIVTIECPGLAADGRYYNMRGEDITPLCTLFDPFMHLASCPTIAIGDGGNEIGMGNIGDALARLDIHPCVTGCDELLVADVSNWGAYALIAMLSRWAQRDLLAEFSPLEALRYLSARGSVDGVTRENTLTEDGLDAQAGLQLIARLRSLANFSHG